MGVAELQMTGNRGTIDKQRPGWSDELTLLYNGARVLEPLITADMRKLSQSLNTDFSGTEYSVKTASSVEDKLQRAEKKFRSNPNNEGEKFDHKSAVTEMKDLVRYTEICEHDNIINVAKDTIEMLEKDGYVLSGSKNYYAEPYPGTEYQGIHLNFITPYGQEIELQVHSNESFEAKQKGHDLYEKIRSVSTKEEDKEQMKKDIKEIHSSISKPYGYLDFPNFEMSLDKKNRVINEKRKDVDIDIVADTNNFVNNEHSIVYSIEKNGEELFYGFEICFSDGSVRSYQNNIRDGIAKECSIDREGREIKTHDAPKMEITLDKVVEIAAEIENRHKNWMERNFSEKEHEDVRNIVKQQNEIVQNRQISEMEFDYQELS